MKKLKVFFALFVLFIGASNVTAASIQSITGGNKNKDTIKISIKDAKEYVFTYDSNYLSCSGTGTSAYDNPYGRLINDDNVTLSCTIKTSKNVSMNLKLVDLNENNPNVTKTYEINPTSTTTTTPTSKPSTTTPKTSKVITNELSSNANLKSLEVRSEENELIVLEPGFKSDIYEYSANVNSDIKKINIEAFMESDKANLVISNNIYEELEAGKTNKFTVTVTAEDGTQKAYIININKDALNNDATLIALRVEEDNSFEFDINKYKYVVNVDENVTSLTLGYSTSKPNVTVDITGNDNLEDGSIVRLLVKAEDGTKKEYTLVVSKTEKEKENKVVAKEEKSALVIISLSLVAVALIVGIIIVIRKRKN